MRARLLLLLPLIMGAAWEKPASDWSFDTDAYVMWVTDGLEPGVVDGLKKKLSESQKHIVAIELDSWGGDGDEGIRLADFISRWPGKVVILRGCYSSCSFAALVALGQGKLLVAADAEVGMHQVTNTRTHQPDVEWTKMAARILQRYGAPKAPLDTMVVTPPNAMAVLHEDQLVSLGAAALKTGWLWWLFGEGNE